MRPKDIIFEQIHHHETDPIPFTLGFEGDIGERMDAYYKSTTWRDRIPRYFAGVGIVNANPSEQIDAAHSRDAFGTIWRNDCRPFHLERPGLLEPSFANYHFPATESFFDPVLENQALEQCKQSTDYFIITGFGWGLFEQSWAIRGFENMLMDVVAEPAFYEELLDRILELQLAFIEASVRLPIDGIMFSDDWGMQTGVTIGPERWRQFIKPRLAKLYSAVHDGGKMTLSHCCGNVSEIMPDIIEIGLDVLESVQSEAMNPYDLKKKWGDKITFWGGLGVQTTVPFGTPKSITAEVRNLCQEMSCGGGFILAPAKPLQPETPTENAVAVFEAFMSATGHERL